MDCSDIGQDGTRGALLALFKTLKTLIASLLPGVKGDFVWVRSSSRLVLGCLLKNSDDNFVHMILMARCDSTGNFLTLMLVS